jgi:hypothetical protein
MNDLKEFDYKPDLEVSDRYVNYSSEILRLSLLGIGGFGTFLLLQYDNTGFQMGLATKILMLISVLFWAVSACLSLAHRYFSSDTLACHINYHRLVDDDRKKKEKEQRRWLLKLCTKLIVWNAISFGLGILIFSMAMILILFQKQLC